MAMGVMITATALLDKKVVRTDVSRMIPEIMTNPGHW